MAGFTSNISSSSSFKPLVSRGTPSSSLVPSLSFLDSRPNFVQFDSNRSVSLSLIIARYGRPNYNNRTSRDTRRKEPDADPAVDMSTLRAGTVRLIDAQQNMVGLVSKMEAIQMAENAELDLYVTYTRISDIN
ncbi:Translation initiation factor if-3, partial [Thalictrum thalictroides]